MGLISRVSSRTYRLTLSSYKKDKKKMADQDWAQEEVVEDVVQDGENFNEGDEFEGEEPLVEDVPVLLFGKWDPSEVKLTTWPLLITSTSRVTRPDSCPTVPADSTRSDSERHSALSSNDSSAL